MMHPTSNDLWSRTIVMLRRSTIVLVTVLVAAGCGGSSSTAKERIAGCLDKQPDATKADCKEWEQGGELDDDGTHKGHDDM